MSPLGSWNTDRKGMYLPFALQKPPKENLFIFWWFKLYSTLYNTCAKNRTIKKIKNFFFIKVLLKEKNQ